MPKENNNQWGEFGVAAIDNLGEIGTGAAHIISAIGIGKANRTNKELGLYNLETQRNALVIKEQRDAATQKNLMKAGAVAAFIIILALVLRYA